MRFLIENDILVYDQHVFYPGRFCITNLVFFVDRLTDACNKGLVQDAVFFYTAKAFDHVPRIPMLAKLRSIGTIDSLLSQLKSLLSGRFLKSNRNSCICLQSYFGVLQSSFLFLIYINNISLSLTSDSLLSAGYLELWLTCNVLLPAGSEPITRWARDQHVPIHFQKMVHMASKHNKREQYTFLHDRNSPI